MPHAQAVNFYRNSNTSPRVISPGFQPHGRWSENSGPVSSTGSRPPGASTPRPARFSRLCVHADPWRLPYPRIPPPRPIPALHRTRARVAVGCPDSGPGRVVHQKRRTTRRNSPPPFRHIRAIRMKYQLAVSVLAAVESYGRLRNQQTPPSLRCQSRARQSRLQSA